MKEYGKMIIQNWRNAWNYKTFRKSLISGMVLLAVMVVLTYYFFNYIQYRKQGIVLNDWVLRMLPAIDVSLFIIFLMSSVVLLYILRSAVNPNMVIIFLMAYALLLATRIITITITRLLAPPELIVLKDPMGSLLYPSKFITQDLFYSGHTASLFLFYLCSTKKIDKYYILMATISVGILLLIQHVHYTVDVVFAPLFAFGCFWLSKKILHLQNVTTTN